MIEPESTPEQDLEDLFRSHLQREADQVDPRPLHAKICATLRIPTSPQNILPVRKSAGRPRLFRRLAWSISAAAAILLAFFGGLHFAPAHASPESLVRQARETHRLPLDRCYLVEQRRESNSNDELRPMPEFARVNRLWTRGDRFWIESVHPRHRWGWGRDETGSVWMADGASRGVHFDPDEVPFPLALACDVNSMQLDTLLTDVLRHFDLQREDPGPDSDPTMYTVRAQAKPGRPFLQLRSALLEIDAETKVLRRVILTRVRPGLPAMTTTYTLVDSQVQDDVNYQIEGHLQEPFEIFTRAHHPERRRDTVMRLMGPPAEQWFRPRPPLEEKGPAKN